VSESKKLLKSTLIYSIGNFGSKIFSFLLVPLYSFYLSKAELGYYDLVITTVTLISPFITLQISDAAYRWLLEDQNNTERQKQTVTSSLSLILLNTIIFFIVFIIALFFIDVKYSIYFFILSCTSVLLIYFQQLLRGFGNNKLYSIAGISNTLLMVLFTIIFLIVLKQNISGLFLSVILANACTILFILFAGKIYRKIDFKFINKSQVKAMLNYSWPLIPNAISWWMINEINRFIILSYLGVNANGIFALASRFPSIILAVNSIFMLSWQDHALSSTGAQESFYTKVFRHYMILEFSFVILLTSASMYIVHYTISQQFYESWKYMPFLYLGVAFSSFAAFLGAGYLKQKKNKGIFFTSIVGSLVNIVINVLLIKRIGLFAPAIGTATGFFVMWLIRLKQMDKILQIKLDVRSFTFLFTGSLVCTWLVFLQNMYVNIVLITLSVILCFVMNKELINYFFQFIPYLKKLKLKAVDE
jgi:O-antigen/teichoic acid export membrane protein